MLIASQFKSQLNLHAESAELQIKEYILSNKILNLSTVFVDVSTFSQALQHVLAYFIGKVKGLTNF